MVHAMLFSNLYFSHFHITTNCYSSSLPQNSQVIDILVVYSVQIKEREIKMACTQEKSKFHSENFNLKPQSILAISIFGYTT